MNDNEPENLFELISSQPQPQLVMQTDKDPAREKNLFYPSCFKKGWMWSRQMQNSHPFLFPQKTSSSSSVVSTPWCVRWDEMCRRPCSQRHSSSSAKQGDMYLCCGNGTQSSNLFLLLLLQHRLLQPPFAELLILCRGAQWWWWLLLSIGKATTIWAECRCEAHSGQRMLCCWSAGGGGGDDDK